jgi:hypothetical protein
MIDGTARQFITVVTSALKMNIFYNDTEILAWLDDPFVAPLVNRGLPRFNYSADRLWKLRPDIYNSITRLLTTPGVTVRSICNVCHVTSGTVESVSERENLAAELPPIESALRFGGPVYVTKRNCDGTLSTAVLRPAKDRPLWRKIVDWFRAAFAPKKKLK